jgi:hypothetical protein
VKTSRAKLTACAVATLVALTGCYGPVFPTVYEPGEYKGASDPLLAKLKTPEMKQALGQRVTLSQTDR